MSATGSARRFEELALPHFSSAYNLARWLTRNDHDARDVVQEAFTRAFRFFDGFRGDDCRPWLLAIVRREFYTWAAARRIEVALPDDDGALLEERGSATADRTAEDPQALLLRKDRREAVRRALEKLPVMYREIVVLREMEDMNYRQIAETLDVPIGTVMSRLARARDRLYELLRDEEVA